MYLIIGAFQTIETKSNKIETTRLEISKVRVNDEKRIIISSRGHLNEMIKNTLNSIPDSKVEYYGGCGFKGILLIEQKADCFLYPSRGYQRYEMKLIIFIYLIFLLFKDLIHVHQKQ